ncbi:MAG: hypothetical protein ABSE73_20115 [Planctomycetota bacterium]
MTDEEHEEFRECNGADNPVHAAETVLLLEQAARVRQAILFMIFANACSLMTAPGGR